MKGVWKTSSKIMIAVMVCASALSVLIGSVVTYQSGKVIEASTYNNLELTAQYYANVFSRSTEQVEATVTAYLSAIKASFDETAMETAPDTYLREYQDEILLPMTEQFARDGKNVLGVYFDFDPYLVEELGPEEQTYGAWYLDRYLDGNIEREQMELKKNFYPENENVAWYYGAAETGVPVWSNPYVDPYTGYYMISYNAPFLGNEQVLGVAGIDILFDTVVSMIEQFRVFETGYAFLLSAEYDVIVGPQSMAGENGAVSQGAELTDINPEYAKLIAAIESGQFRNITIGGNYDKSILSYAKMSNGYTVVIQVKSEEIFSEMDRIRAMIDVLTLCGILLAAIIAYVLGKYISRPTEEAQQAIRRMMHFDLRKEKGQKTESRARRGDRELVDEAEAVRSEIAHTIYMARKNAAAGTAATDKLERCIGRLEVLHERIYSIMIVGSKEPRVAESMRSEYREMLREIKELIAQIHEMNRQNAAAMDVYYIDEP